MTRVVSGEVLRVDELDGYQHDESTGNVVSRVRDLMRRAKVPIVQMEDQLELIVIKGAELTESLLNLLHHRDILCSLRIDCYIAIVVSRVGGVRRALVSALASLWCLV